MIQQRRDWTRSDIRLIQSCLHLSNPWNCGWRAYAGVRWPSNQPHAPMWSLRFALYIHEILIYNALISTRQGSLAKADQSYSSSSLPPRALMLTFVCLTQLPQAKQSKAQWSLSTWIPLSWGWRRGGCSNKERNVTLMSEGIIAIHFSFGL